jgi:hypothetical protein
MHSILNSFCVITVIFIFLSCEALKPKHFQAETENQNNKLSRRTGSEGTWYQIFTISFYDSNRQGFGRDGLGDLLGISEKLDYLSCLPLNCDIDAAKKPTATKAFMLTESGLRQS